MTTLHRAALWLNRNHHAVDAVLAPTLGTIAAVLMLVAFLAR